eukprot:scaffold309953_cov33-Prasinocladus_malaysianus.AAC.1
MQASCIVVSRLTASAGRSWAFLCEKLHEESQQTKRRSSIASRVGSGAKSGLKSGMKSGMKSDLEANKTNADCDGEDDDSDAGNDMQAGGESEMDEEDLMVPPPELSESGISWASLKTVWKLNGLGGVIKALAAGDSGEKSVAEEFTLWQKKGQQQDPEYLAGRLAVGQAFLDVFASKNAWAVKQFDFGLNPQHAEKMGEALELIVNSATKPQVLQHKLRVLALGHVQMGIKPEMFKHFEVALFDFLAQ